jgi:hypothetical protein
MPPDDPQNGAATIRARTPSRTMTATDHGEHGEPGMSLTQQPVDADGRRPRRGRGERLAVLIGAVVTVLAAIGVVFLVTGDSDQQPAPAPPAPAARTSTQPSSDAAPQTPADIAAAEAQQRYREFVRVQDLVAQGGFANPELYETVAIDPERTQLILEARQFAGARVTGDTQVASLTVESVQLPSEPAEHPSVRLVACLDVTQVQAVDANDTSLVSPDRPDRIASRVLLQQFEPGDFAEDPERSGWYVAEVEQRGEPC